MSMKLHPFYFQETKSSWLIIHELICLQST